MKLKVGDRVTDKLRGGGVITRVFGACNRDGHRGLRVLEVTFDRYPDVTESRCESVLVREAANVDQD